MTTETTARDLQWLQAAEQLLLAAAGGADDLDDVIDLATSVAESVAARRDELLDAKPVTQ